MTTRVTCTDTDSGESETAEIRDNFILITDGRCYLASQQIYANGTTVLTVNRHAPSYEGAPDASTP